MRKSRYTDEQIIGFIKQADAGMGVADLALGLQQGRICPGPLLDPGPKCNPILRHAVRP